MSREKTIEAHGKTIVLRWKVKGTDSSDETEGEEGQAKRRRTADASEGGDVEGGEFRKKDGRVCGKESDQGSSAASRSETSGGGNEELMRDERKLTCEVKTKEEKVRKLKLVKMYRSKNNLDELDQLVAKWRTASQLAAQELCDHMGTEGKRPTVQELLAHFQIDHDIIGYSEEDDEFVEQ